MGGKKANICSKGNILVMGDICKICYLFQDVLSDADIKRSRNIGGDNNLLIFRDCFNSNIKIPTLEGSSNAREKEGKRGTAKKGNYKYL